MTENELQNLIESLTEMPETVKQFVNDFGNGATWKLSEKEFSFLENVCHLNDIEREGYAVRIEKLLNENQPFLYDVDGGKLAAERDYNSQNLDDALRLFADSRQANLERVKNLSPEQLNRSGEFENVGAVTLARILTMMREHDAAHIRELNVLREFLAQSADSAK